MDTTKTNNPKAINWLFSGHFIIDNYSGFLSPILPFIALKLGITLAMTTLLISISHISSSLTQPLFGFIADKWKKRFFIFWGLMFTSVFMSLVGVAPNIWVLGICIILGGLGLGFFHPQALGFVNFFSSEDKISGNLGIFIALGTLGYAVGPVVSSSVVDFLGLESMSLLAIFGIITALLVFKCVPKVSIISEKNPSPTGLLKSFKNVLTHPIMRILILLSVLKSLITMTYCLLLPFLWQSMGYSASKIGIILFIFLISGAFGTYFSSKAESIIGMKKVFYISMMSVMPLTIGFFLTYKTMPALSSTIFALIGFLVMLSVSVNFVLAQKILPEYKSMTSGFIGGFSFGAVGALLALIGFIAQHIGIEKLLIIISFIPFFCAYFIKYLPEDA